MQLLAVERSMPFGVSSRWHNQQQGNGHGKGAHAKDRGRVYHVAHVPYKSHSNENRVGPSQCRT